MIWLFAMTGSSKAAEFGVEVIEGGSAITSISLTKGPSSHSCTGGRSKGDGDGSAISRREDSTASSTRLPSDTDRERGDSIAFFFTASPLPVPFFLVTEEGREEDRAMFVPAPVRGESGRESLDPMVR